MESVLIVAPHDYDAELRQRASISWKLSDGPDRTWAIDDPQGRIYVSRNEWACDELEPERLAQIKAIIQNPIFYSMDFSDLNLSRRVLMTIADDPNLLIDNDHGVLLSGSEFVRLLRSRENWDWRLDTP
jgi:hypothetical protein